MTDEEAMGRWFVQQTQPQLNRYNQRMIDVAPYRNAPRWDRERMTAQREFHEDTAAARYLYEMAMSDLMNFGEITEATDDALSDFDTNQLMAAE